MSLKTVDVAEARTLLQRGDVVAIPTETVYGLGGWIHSESGLRKIFSIKERPFFDPLIVHVASPASARSLAKEWTEVHEALARTCWPGPLTLIAPKTSEINPLITSGLDSVGLRCPRHAVALQLLSGIEGGIAAPSANKFGKTSPTTSAHVYAEFGAGVSILEGGPSEIGIESTVAGVVGNRVEIYRPGFYTASMLRKLLAEQGVMVDVVYAVSPVAPGQLKHHYMPKIPLVIVPEGFSWKQDPLLVSVPFRNPVLWQQPASAAVASRELYQKMREFDAAGFDIIFAERRPEHDAEEWGGIWNRLEKAKTQNLV